ncbi:conjugation system TraG family ATPase [Dyadobacter jejuensis]|uniref:Conjugation system TraG family ATPase n=1 Tax=Dyadobacter jejuensis TaxID=1082580 RepID=A0A316A6S7_9BACT|nr:TraG family conjugative transposon ATPase [Dyadobacter jejuensis]PWJ53415.1 conjugation system TraG family ATPase [Dyadobacter jejuensis]
MKKLEDIFPLLQISDDGLVISKNADLSYFFEISYPEIFVTGSYEYGSIIDAILNSAKSLGEGYIIHKQDYFIEDTYKPNFTYNDTGDEIIRENERHFKDRPFTSHKGFIFITLPSSPPHKRDSAQSSLFKKSILPNSARDTKTLLTFQEKVSSFISGINQTKSLRLKRLNRSEIVGTSKYPGLLNYYFTLSFTDNNLYDINSENSNFKVGNKNTYTFVINDLEQLPNEIVPISSFRDFSGHSNMPISFGSSFGINIPFNHIYNQIFYITSQSEVVSEKTKEIKRHYSFSQWSRDNTYSLNQKTVLIDTMKAGELAVLAHFNVQLFHQDNSILNEYKDIVAGAITNAQFTAKIATTYAEQLYWSTIPGNVSEIGRDNLYTCMLSNAVSMFNLETNYKDSPYQNNGLLLTDRFGMPRIVDLFMKPREEGLITNRNFTIIGPSGSGKSFTNNNLIYYLRNSGVHISIVDIGYSYKRLGEILGAKYIEHTDSNPISLNPFFTQVNIDGLDNKKATQLREEFKQTIVQIIFLLFKKENEQVSKTEEVTIYNMVNGYYDYLAKNNAKHNPSSPQFIRACFNTFYDYSRTLFPEEFKNQGGRENIDFDLSKFHYVLSPFYEGGQYDYLLNGKEDIELSKHPFVIYELENIKDHPILLPIVTLVITNTYIAKLFEVRGVLKVLLIEEAWKAISSDFFATFLLWAFKTARKHFGAIGVITQEIEDLLKSEIIKETIIQNTDIKIIMDINKYEEDHDMILSLFKISNANIPQIFSINKPLPNSKDRPPYKELAVILGKHCKVYGTEVSRYAYSLFTTEATEVDEIKAISENNNISLYEASMQWADRKK